MKPKEYSSIYTHTNITGHYNPSISITTSLLAPVMLYALMLCICSGAYSLKSRTTDF